MEILNSIKKIDKCTNTVILIAVLQVNHSQRLNEKQLQPWVAVCDDGTIKSAHCTCMAGLGEACSHIAATLFAVSAAVNLRDGQSCTSQKCKWSQPSMDSVKKVPFAKGSDICFSSAQRKRKAERKSNTSATQQQASPGLSKEEQNALYDRLYKAEAKEEIPVKSAILALIPGHSHRYIPRPMTLNIPPSLMDMYKADNLKLMLPELKTKCQETMESLHITKEQVPPTQLSLIQ